MNQVVLRRSSVRASRLLSALIASVLMYPLGTAVAEGKAWTDAPEPSTNGNVMWAEIYQTPESTSFGAITSYACGPKSVYGLAGSTGGVNPRGGDRLGSRYVYFASECNVSQAGTWAFDRGTYRFALANGFYRYAGELVAPSPSTSTSTTTSTTSTTIVESDSTSTSTTSRRARSTTTTLSPTFVEDDGTVEEEEDFAEITVRTFGGRTQISVFSSYPSKEMTIRARAKSRPTVTWEFATGQNGIQRIVTTRRLSGYTLSLWVEGERLDSFKVR